MNKGEYGLPGIPDAGVTFPEKKPTPKRPWWKRAIDTMKGWWTRGEADEC